MRKVLEQGKVEVDEIDFGFCLIHVLIVFLPYESSDVLRIYKLLKQDNQSKKLMKLRTKYVVTHLNLFTQYEQDMAKSIIFLDYYHNVHEGWYECW